MFVDSQDMAARERGRPDTVSHRPVEPRRLRVMALIGIDGAGKTTQARWLAGTLTANGLPATYHLNAGGRRWLSRIARRLHRRDAESLLGTHGLVLMETVLRWLAMARALLLSRLRGSIAVMDRYSYCQYAEIAARGGQFERLARVLFGVFPAPDRTFFLSVPTDEAHARIERRAMDAEGLDYLARFDAAYRELPEAAKFEVIDANRSPERVQRDLLDRLWSLPNHTGTL
jgi:dTMP kinase